MPFQSAKNIDQVIEALEVIIEKSKINQSPVGYFAALYKKATLQVKKGINEGFFENNERMENLDVVFANRYLEAYYQYTNHESTTDSWLISFENTKKYGPIVLQHLLLGMNAHISLDLGIAAAQISIGNPIEDLKNDFDKINEVLANLVHEVENDLSEIWPKLKKILTWFQGSEKFLLDFSMEIAREGAWGFAVELSNSQSWGRTILHRDKKIMTNSKLITRPGFIANLIFKMIRFGEKGSVSQKIDFLSD